MNESDLSSAYLINNRHNIFTSPEHLIKRLAFDGHGPQAIVDLVLLMFPSVVPYGKCSVFPAGIRPAGIPVITRVEEWDIMDLLRPLSATVTYAALQD
eukprot:4458842-Pyramimonas_sp.AAC.1